MKSAKVGRAGCNVNSGVVGHGRVVPSFQHMT